MTQDELAALDRAATQQTAEHEGTGTSYPFGDKEMSFRAELARLYRAGRIAVIDDGAVEALRANKQGWENAIELNLLPSRHHDTARALIEQCTAAIAKAKDRT